MGSADDPTISPCNDPWAYRRRSLRLLLSRARSWQDNIATGLAQNAADVALQSGVSRARVSQVMGLLALSPEILAELEDPQGQGAVPTELQLRRLAKVWPEDLQVATYERMCEEQIAPRHPGRSLRVDSRVRRKGFQHLFAEARRLQAMWDSGEHRSLRALGEAIGVTGERVGQILNLLHLHPEIIEALDVPVEEAPEGITTKMIRGLARVRDREEQLRRFEGMLGEGRGLTGN